MPYTTQTSRGSVDDKVLRNPAANQATVVVDLPITTGVYSFGTAVNGVFLASCVANSIIFLVNGTTTTVVAQDAGAAFSTTKDTATKLNFYVEGGEFKVQNTNAATKDVTIVKLADTYAV